MKIVLLGDRLLLYGILTELWIGFQNISPEYGYTIIRDLMVLLPGEQMSTITWLGDQVLFLDNTSITSSIMGIGYIDFKLTGVIAYCFITGFVLSVVSVRTMNQKIILLRNLYSFVLLRFHCGLCPQLVLLIL